jgi:hypothetical protein
MTTNLASISARNELLSAAQYGEITSAEAEAKAAEMGWPPFERQPALPAFDPMLEARWSLVMTVAWIAWRDLALVREQHSGFRADSTHWLFREWNGPAPEGGVERHAGYFVETWSKSSATRLSLVDIILEGRDEFPPTRQMSVADAREILWRALSEGRLVAEALDSSGKPIEIPTIEWSYLKLYEERELDVLKHNALDNGAAFTDVKFRREDVLGLWHQITYVKAALEDTYLIDESMVEPVENQTAGYVPLCSALHWMMTRGGMLRLRLDDEEAWDAACDKLIPSIHAGRVELIGLPRGGALTEKIPGYSLPLVKVLHPLRSDFSDSALSAPSHIVCTPFVDQEHWSADFNDRLYLRGQAQAAWTHLQVCKSDVLDRCPRPEKRVKPQQDCFHWLLDQMRDSPSRRPKTKEMFRREANSKFSLLKVRQFNSAWDHAIMESGASAWSARGRPKLNQNAH